MSGATNKVSLIEKVVALLAPLNQHVETLPELEAARKCASLAPKLSTVPKLPAKREAASEDRTRSGTPQTFNF